MGQAGALLCRRDRSDLDGSGCLIVWCAHVRPPRTRSGSLCSAEVRCTQSAHTATRTLLAGLVCRVRSSVSPISFRCTPFAVRSADTAFGVGSQVLPSLRSPRISDNSNASLRTCPRPLSAHMNAPKTSSRISRWAGAPCARPQRSAEGLLSTWAFILPPMNLPFSSRRPWSAPSGRKRLGWNSWNSRADRNSGWDSSSKPCCSRDRPSTPWVKRSTAPSFFSCLRDQIIDETNASQAHRSQEHDAALHPREWLERIRITHRYILDMDRGLTGKSRQHGPPDTRHIRCSCTYHRCAGC